MCFYCFDTLIEALEKQERTAAGRKGRRHVEVFAPDLPHAAVECPLFVTWDKSTAPTSAHPRWQLRGCIGTLGPRRVVDAIGDYALIAALKDKRFQPIQLSELAFLRVAVSLLVNYEPCEDAYDWTVGVHGIMIDFVVDGRTYSATYLPEVAKEQGWTIPQAVESLIQKAGYRGKVSKELLRSIRCTRYQSSKCRVTFNEYLTEYCNGEDPFQPGTMSTEERSKLSACKQM